jgi:uncharacterized zinc-type alcohol dehydrogenase-like protein
VDSCMHCDQCEHGEEQFCRNGMTPTYGAPDRLSGEITQGGYAKHIVVREGRRRDCHFTVCRFQGPAK